MAGVPWCGPQPASARPRLVGALRSLPRANFEGGNGQAKTWIIAAGALSHLRMHPVDYVAAYRSPASTGCGMPFAYWD